MKGENLGTLNEDGGGYSGDGCSFGINSIVDHSTSTNKYFKFLRK